MKNGKLRLLGGLVRKKSVKVFYNFRMANKTHKSYMYIYISRSKKENIIILLNFPFEIIFCIFMLINLVLTETLGISIVGYLRNDEKDGYE